MRALVLVGFLLGLSWINSDAGGRPMWPEVPVQQTAAPAPVKPKVVPPHKPTAQTLDAAAKILRDYAAEALAGTLLSLFAAGAAAWRSHYRNRKPLDERSTS